MLVFKFIHLNMCVCVQEHYIKLMYVVFTLSINNISILLLVFIRVPLVTIYKYLSLLSLIFRYIYLGVIIIFIIMGIIILNIKINLLINPAILIGFLRLHTCNIHTHIGYLRVRNVVIIFTLLLILIYIISDLLMFNYYIKNISNL